MNSLFGADIIYITSDITAGVFLIVLIISIAVQITRRTGLTHLLAASIFTMAGIFSRISAGMMEVISNGLVRTADVDLVTPTVVTALCVIAYILLTIGITESVTHVIYINEENSKKDLGTRYVTCMIFAFIGAVLFCIYRNINIFSVLNLALFGYYWLSLYRNWSERTRHEFVCASVFAVTTFVLDMVFGRVRLTGLGLSVMLMILAVQYHSHVKQELAEKEAALTKSRVQLLADQISPHYVYNSLQSISSLCDTDPSKAKEALDAFAAYLRGNLESLTEEDLIPFSKELEYTKAYLELESLSSSRRFVAEYDLEVTDFMLPPLVLQPVVENAVKHGAANVKVSGDKGDKIATKITITTREHDGYIYIEVTNRNESSKAGAAEEMEDTGTANGAPANAKNNCKKKSVGLENVRTRLALQCDGTLGLRSSGESTTATIMLPSPHKTTQTRNGL